MTSEDKENLIIGPGEGKILPVPGHKITSKIPGESTGGRFVLAELELTGYGPPRHIHKTEDEFFYVLEGEVKFLLGGQIQIVKAGSTLIVPMGTVHAYARVNKKNAKLLGIFSPAGAEKFFDEVLEGGVADTESYIAKTKALAEKYNIEVVGPPLDD